MKVKINSGELATGMG